MPPSMAVAIRRVQDDKMKRKEQQATGINFKADSSCAALFCLFIQDRFCLQDAILSFPTLLLKELPASSMLKAPNYSAQKGESTELLMPN